MKDADRVLLANALPRLRGYYMGRGERPALSWKNASQPDGQPIDLAILLLSPEGAGADHLKALARISRTLRDPAILAAMRTAVTEAELRAAIGPPQASDKRAA